MLQLLNQTPYAPGMFLFPDENGVDTMYAVVKATFDISSGTPVLAPMQRPVQLADEYFGDPASSSLKYASEAHLQKPGCDVVVVGEAVAPGGKAVLTMRVSLTVGERQQIIQVVGDRQWKGSRLKAWPGDPAPFLRMPLVYERAFGGMQTIHNEDGTQSVYAEPYNPVGVGYRGQRTFEEIQQEPVPNLEDPNAPITSLNTQSPPVGFGFVAPFWSPRLQYVGTYDNAWQKQRAPYFPKDFDNRFYNVASTGWTFENGLKGGEATTLSNMTDEGTLSFELPTITPGIEVVVSGNVVCPDTHLETVLIEPSLGLLTMTFRGSVPCDKKALEVSEVRIIQ